MFRVSAAPFRKRLSLFGKKPLGTGEEAAKHYLALTSEAREQGKLKKLAGLFYRKKKCDVNFTVNFTFFRDIQLLNNNTLEVLSLLAFFYGN